MKKALILSGGTGGHIFPALSLSEALATHFEIKFTATRPTPLLPASQTFLLPFSLPSLRNGAFSYANSALAFFRSHRILQKFAPDLILSFGGYPAFPLLALKASHRIPLFLIESNAKAGKVNQWFSSRAKKAFLQFPEAAPDLACPTHLSGLPTRNPKTEKAPFQKPFLLFIGGSQGAQSIAEKALYASHALKKRGFQTILIAGNLYPSLQATLKQHPAPLTLLRFVENPLPLFAAAEIVVSRSGASTLAELTLMGACPLLLPYPFADRHHQYANALSLQKKTGVPLLPDTISPSAFTQKLLDLLDQKTFRKRLRQKMKQAAYPHAAQTICTALRESI